MSKWLGAVGCKQVLDLRNAPLRLVITLAPNVVLLANSTAATYTLADVHLTLRKVDDAGSATKVMEYDNYKSILQYQTSYAKKHNWT